MLEAILKSNSAVESESENKTPLITSLAKMMSGPPRPPPPKKPDAATISQKGEKFSGTQHQSISKSRLSKPKDTLSEVSQVSEKKSDMAKRMLYEKRDLQIKNQMLEDSLVKLQDKYNKLKDKYMELKEKFLEARKNVCNQVKLLEVSQDILNQSMPIDDPPAVIKVKEPEPESKLSKSFVLNETSQPQLQDLLEFGSRQPSQTEQVNLFRPERKPNTLQLPMLSATMMDWSNGSIVSPLLDKKKLEEEQNKQLRREVEALRIELEQLRHLKDKSSSIESEVTNLKKELTRTSNILFSEYDKLLRIKEIVKNIGIDFVHKDKQHLNDQAEKQNAQRLIKEYFNSLDM